MRPKRVEPLGQLAHDGRCLAVMQQWMLQPLQHVRDYGALNVHNGGGGGSSDRYKGPSSACLRCGVVDAGAAPAPRALEQLRSV